MQVVGVAHTFVEVWETVAGMLTELDVLLGFAELAVCAPTPYVRPTMLGPESGESLQSTLCRQMADFMHHQSNRKFQSSWPICGSKLVQLR